jgi:hypothetical protein
MCPYLCEGGFFVVVTGRDIIMRTTMKTIGVGPSSVSLSKSGLDSDFEPDFDLDFELCRKQPNCQCGLFFVAVY